MIWYPARLSYGQNTKICWWTSLLENRMEVSKGIFHIQKFSQNERKKWKSYFHHIIVVVVLLTEVISYIKNIFFLRGRCHTFHIFLYFSWNSHAIRCCGVQNHAIQLFSIQDQLILKLEKNTHFFYWRFKYLMLKHLFTELGRFGNWVAF